MSNASPGMNAALQGLSAALGAPRREGPALGGWRWTVRQRLAAVRDALLAENGAADDGWLAARGGASFRERNTLLERLGVLGTSILEEPDVEAVRSDAGRLLVDIGHHVQRLNDLAYDEVELELGGSE